MRIGKGKLYLFVTTNLLLFVFLVDEGVVFVFRRAPVKLAMTAY